MALRVFASILILCSTLFSAGFGNAEKQKFLSPAEAFKVTATQKEDGILIDVKLGKDIYIYADTLKLLLQDSITSVKLEPTLPKTDLYMDEDVYRESFTLNIPRE